LHRFDLMSKVSALSIAQQLVPMPACRSNLLPQSLLADANAVDFLVQRQHATAFTPDRIVLEVTEEEAITDPTCLPTRSSAFALQACAWPLMTLAPGLQVCRSWRTFSLTNSRLTVA